MRNKKRTVDIDDDDCCIYFAVVVTVSVGRKKQINENI
jgi:hypothetical protein